MDMDACPALASDTEFDAYWEEEARNPHRNRIRIGRQYQATIPPPLKSGDVDGRKFDQLETLAWRKDNGLSSDKLDDYFFTSRALSLMARHKARLKEVKGDAGTGPAADGEATSCPPATATSTTASAKNGSCADSSRPGPKSRKEFEERKAMLAAELVNLTSFVSTHHPANHDPTCHFKDGEVRNEKWSVNEARLFAHALENYGKNFGAIKKAMPWKPAKCLIDHYYKKGEEGAPDGDHEDGSDGHEDGLSPCDPDAAVFSKADFPTSLQVACFTSSERFESQSINWKKLKDSDQQQHQKNGTMSQSINHLNKSSSNMTDAVVGAEIKPMKAKPIFPSETVESAANGNGNSLLGSLKFFMDGQLVLKLNANQQESDKKCHWVESQDTPKIAKSVKNKKYKHKSSTSNGADAGAGGETSSSKTSEDTGDEESSDDESVGSESRSLPSPSDWRSLPTAAAGRKNNKVKVENNCLVPVATSAQLASLQQVSSPTPLTSAGDRSSKSQKSGEQAAVSPAAGSSAKRSSEFSAFPFDNHHSPADSKKIKKRLKASTSISNKLNHKTISNNNHSSNVGGKSSSNAFPRPEEPNSRSSSGRGPPQAHSSLIDLSSKSGSSSGSGSSNRTTAADDASNCGLDLSVKPITRSSSGSPSSQLQYPRSAAKQSSNERRRHVSGSAAVNLSLPAKGSSGSRPAPGSSSPRAGHYLP